MALKLASSCLLAGSNLLLNFKACIAVTRSIKGQEQAQHKCLCLRCCACYCCLTSLMPEMQALK